MVTTESNYCYNITYVYELPTRCSFFVIGWTIQKTRELDQTITVVHPISIVYHPIINIVLFIWQLPFNISNKAKLLLFLLWCLNSRSLWPLVRVGWRHDEKDWVWWGRGFERWKIWEKGRCWSVKVEIKRIEFI